MRSDSPICRTLRADLEGLSYKARYFLAQVVCTFGCRPVDHTLSQLSDSFGMSRSSLVGAKKELESAWRGTAGRGYLTNCQPVGGEPCRGRPRAGFMLSTSFAAEMGLLGAPFHSTSIQEAAVQVILSGGAGGVLSAGRPGGTPAAMASKLSVSGRLLLVTLWSFSDERGLVSGVGFGQLARLLSVKMPRLRRQLKELEKHLYLEYKLSGLTGRYVPGKAPSVAVLRFRHSDYGTWLPTRHEMLGSLARSGYPRVLFIYQRADDIDRDRELAKSRGRISGLSEAGAQDLEAMVWGRLNKRDRPQGLGEHEPFYLYKAFAAEPQRWQVQNFLIFKLYEYASYLINHFAQRLVKPGIDMVDQVRDRIEQELCSNPALEKLLGPQAPDMLARWLYVFAHDFGREALKEIGRHLDQTSTQLSAEVGKRYTDFLILPGAQLGEIRVTFADSAKSGGSHPLIVHGTG
ncbi:hypothetical protein P40_14905 [Alloalcanivorax xenomutans]|jgi:hypothetical protein|nr:hypothetical protein P40_14905 [Alloalcanivorax xenomutans]ERS12833.1 hypothetical protein Q668_16995 [Alcanivorax sp. PN-3]KYZ86882.1 hypothetical protein A3Q32_15085 [Alcanivorax sp. KX64203]PHS62526.1 MAG: hypothetical protein COB00_12495 [Alcanivorax sp.]CUR46978.1 hypothetical protein BN2364_2537 [Alloalcanivorax xenomutans]